MFDRQAVCLCLLGSTEGSLEARTTRPGSRHSVSGITRPRVTGRERRSRGSRVGAAVRLEPGEREELSDREHSLFSRPRLSSWHAALFEICRRVRSTLNRTTVVLPGCGESGGNLALFPALATRHCKLLLTTIECCLISSCCSRFRPG